MSVLPDKGWCPVCHRPVESTRRGGRIARHDDTIGRRCWVGSGLPFRVATADDRFVAYRRPGRPRRC